MALTPEQDKQLNPTHKCGIQLYHRIYQIALRFKLRRQCLEEQNYQCYWCRRPLSIWWQKIQSGAYNKRRHRRSNAELDHIIPRCQGGENVRTNLCAACTECNRKRSILYLAGVGKFDVIGQETQRDLLERYKLKYSSNHNTKKKYRKEELENANTAGD